MAQANSYMHYFGEEVPPFIARCSSGNDSYHFDTVAGRYITLFIFKSASANPEVRKFLDWIHLAKDFDDENHCFFGISHDAKDEEILQSRLPGIRYIWDDADGRVTSLIKGKRNLPDNYILVLDPLLRCFDSYMFATAEKAVSDIGKMLKSLPGLDLYAGVKNHAPVLIMPRIFEKEFCRELIDLYEKTGGAESGFMRDKAEKTIGVIDYGFKRRQDVNIDIQPEYEELRRAIQLRIYKRLLPQIKKAFGYNATHMERYLIARYDGVQGGFFKPHRDNTTKATLHRKFAVTINLNAEEYEGGNLKFSEFGTDEYRAPTGGAVVFSCSLMHEALPVTKGVRYAFLPFLYDAAGAELRAENVKFIDNAGVKTKKS